MDRPPQDECFMRLFVAHERDVLRYVLAVVPQAADARDIVQETAMSLWKKMDEYDPARPFLPWACRFASVEIRRFLRRTDRQQRLLQDGAVEVLLARQEQLAGPFGVRRAYLRECLDELPGPPRRLLRQYYWEETSVEVLAERLGRSAAAVYKAMQRARQMLADCMSRKAAQERAAV